MATVAANPEVRPVVGQQLPWPQLAMFALLLGALYGQTIYKMAREWFELEEMGHGIFVPFVAGYIVWQKREEILRQPIKPNWWGIPLILWGFIQLLLGHLGADFFVERTALFASLAGVILTCCGTAVFRTLLFPLVILLFMIRLPLFIYSQITFPLQIFASTVAEKTLMLLNIPVLRDGNVLELANQRLSVVEACSGIRSLISLAFLSLIYAHFFDSKPWMRWVLLVAAVPIAILANAVRVTLTGIMSEYNKEFAEGIYHTLEGWVIFVVALVILILVHQLINKTYSLVHHER
jgi:exosortase